MLKKNKNQGWRSGRTIRSKNHILWLRSLCCIVIFSMIAIAGVGEAANHNHRTFDMNMNPYGILGVRRTASVQEIKAAYRQKAKDTHPDKNPNVNPDVAAENFRKVVDAFEILSDPNTRKRYDAKWNQHQNQKQRQRQQREQQKRQQEQQKRQQEQERQRKEQREREEERLKEQEHQRLKRDPDVKQAQSRVMRISSLEQLKTVMLDENGRLERNLFMAFVGNKKIEKIVDDTFLFPYPFAGMSKNKIWWEELLQSIKVRYNAESELTKFFNIPSKRQHGKPIIVFARQGDKLSEFRVYNTNSFGWKNRDKLEQWVHEQLTTTLTIHNHHRHHVKIYRVDDDNNSVEVLKIPPQGTATTRGCINDNFVARDERVDIFPGSTSSSFKLSTNSNIADKTIKSYGSTFQVDARNCIDLSGYCGEWIQAKLYTCDEFPEFMHGICPLTCGVCVEKPTLLFTMKKIFSGASSPIWMKVTVKFINTYWDDVEHVLKYRKNAVFLLGTFGLLLGVKVGSIAYRWIDEGKLIKARDQRSSMLLFSYMYLVALCFVWMYCFMQNFDAYARRERILIFLSVFKRDLSHVWKFRKNAIAFVAVGGLLLGFIPELVNVVFLCFNMKNTNDRQMPVPALYAGIGSFGVLLFFLIPLYTKVLHNDMLHIHFYRKNIAAVFLFNGFIVGRKLTSFWKRQTKKTQNGWITWESIIFMAYCHIPVFFSLINCSHKNTCPSWMLLQNKALYKDLEHIFKLRKNVGFSFAFVGYFIGLVIFIWSMKLQAHASGKIRASEKGQYKHKQD